MPPVGVIDLPGGATHIKSGYLGGEQFAVKVVSAFAASGERSASSDGFVALCSARTGAVEALLLDGGWITDARTAAAGVVATQALADPGASCLAVLGTGVQAGLHVRALARVRRLDRVLVWGRTAQRLGAFTQALAADLPDVDVVPVGAPRMAVVAADIVLTATSSRQPILYGAWLRPGQHVTAIGADEPGQAELDGAALRRADLLVVDDRAQSLVLGDVARAVDVGELSPADVDAELGEVLSGRVPGRTSPDQITVAKLTGVGVQDIAAAVEAVRLVHEAAGQAL
jgi:ornithine cyclodeaminase/alanine dehydrogenase-like protein (mu-crystallin family)